MIGSALLALAACDGNNVGGGTGGGGTGGDTGGGNTGGSGPATKVDILFAIDNSRSMADKQEILSLALSDLLTGLANPPCLDESGKIVAQPATPADMCPAGSARQYKPVTDIHIGVISSSLGGHGSDACAETPMFPTNNDKGHLLDRLDPASGGTVPTYQGQGFLAWDPMQQMSPPGEANPAVIAQSFKDMVLGVGQIGCGYESQLESIYRFLVDPAPYQSLSLVNGGITKQGVDTELLQQRQAFLRPDSLVIVLSLSDENDCSIREQGQFYYAAQLKGPNGAPFHLPAARAICATDPDDVCCISCGQVSPKDENGNDLCPPDPTCQAPGGGVRMLTDMEDNINLRCFDQKRRFGIDFLYPTDRYVQGFSSPTITDESGQVIPNPLIVGRGAELVVFAGVVGVPWQDVAQNPDDLKQGFKNGAQMSASDWDYVLGPNGDPFMIESIAPRSGSNTKPSAPVPVTMPGTTNGINGSERSIPQNDDLQYACTLPIPTPRDCSDPTMPACDCWDPMNDNPLCEVEPATGERTLQTRAKAYPGLRQLRVMKDLGEQSVVGSICAGQIDNPAAPDYAYRPVVSSILASVKGRLQ